MNPPSHHALLAAGLSLCLAASDAYAQGENAAVAFDIGAQSLSSALLKLSEASGVKILFKEDLVRGLSASALQGRYTADEALNKLLTGSGLNYRHTAPDAVTLEKTPVVSPDQGATLKKVTVTARTEEASSGYSVFKSATATKTDTPVMETPVSIQVVPKAVMEDQKATRIKDALENVSGVRSQPTLGLGNGFIIRGFRNGLVYRNGLLANSGGFNSEFDTANLESVEVLKGPASMLFGRSEPGGLINITTKRPLDLPFYALEQRFGSFDFYRTEWDAAGPITGDKSLLYRFSGSYQNNNSFRNFISNDRVMISPSITWRPTDATDFTVNVEGVNQDFQADFGIPVIGKRPAPIPVGRAFGDPNDPIDNLSKVHLGTTLNHSFNEDWAVHHRFLASYTHEDETFINPTPVFDDTLAFNPATGTLNRNVFFEEDDAEVYSTNLDLTGKFRLGQTKHETLVGFDYYRSFSNYHVQGSFLTPNPALAINIFNPAPSFGIPSSVFRDTLRTVDDPTSNFAVFRDQWYGAYFQDHITLWDKLHILGGGRYDWIETGSAYKSSFSAAEAALPSQRNQGFNPRVGILYQPWSWLSVYGNWTTSLGANNGVDATGKTFAPQIGEQFEAGVKAEGFDRRLMATLAYYHLTKDDLLTPDLSTPNLFDFKAIGQQRSQGVEFDVTGHVTDSFSLIGSYAYTDAIVTKDNSGLQGKRLTNVPRHAGSLWLKYDIDGYDAAEGWSFGVGGVGAGQREGDVPNTFQLPGFVRVDAFAAYRMKVGPSRVTTQFNIHNLLDKRYFESTDPFFNVAPRLGVYPGAPLTAMGSVRVEF